MKDDPLKKPLFPAKQQEKKVPTVYRHIIRLEWQRRFPWWQRICILFGCSLNVQVGIATQHQTGEFHPIFLGVVSKQTTPDARHREIIENMISEKPYNPIQTENERPETLN